MVKCLIRHGCQSTGITVLTPYRSQLDSLRKRLTTLNINVSTIDAFQGQQNQVVILVTVRSNSTGALGFLDDPKRINMSLTRAENALFIIGNFDTLLKGSNQSLSLIHI